VDAVEIFGGPLRIERIDQRGHYGEERRQVCRATDPFRGLRGPRGSAAPDFRTEGKQE
jgi:hypothetical protein